MPEPRRTRYRRSLQRLDKQKIVDRVLTFYERDDTDRGAEKEARMQRYAKLRLWTEGKDWPWENASDAVISDMLEKSLRMQDTLHNAVMSSRPVIGAKSLQKADAAKERTIDELIDFQVFQEQPGEEILGDIIDAFVNDGVFIAFVPWVKELREVSDARVFPPAPDDVRPFEYFQALLRREHGDAGMLPLPDSEGWDWVVETAEGELSVAFYTARGGGIEMVTQREVVVYDGPRIIQKEWEEVLYPAQAANLHVPGPSNPHGAGHVILVDFPSVDEVARLAKAGIYDRLTGEDIEALRNVAGDDSSHEMRKQKDDLQGVTPQPAGSDREAPAQKTLTRLMCFDLFDVDGDGIAEDVVWWVIKETKVLARGKLLTEVFPSAKPRRPLVHRALLPVRGRVAGISLLETMEGLHDLVKTLTDQIVDSATIKIAPPWFYRAAGSVKPEIIRWLPGEGYPLQDPERDIKFPQFNTQTEVLGLNLISMLLQMEERVTTIGELQLGRVPQGKSSALRTLGGMAMIAGQGEARPERILRRFFSGLAEIWRHIHGLNQFFLPEKKMIRLIGLKDVGEDPYREVARLDASGDFDFDFKANVLNTSKLALQQSLQELLSVYVSELALSFGIVDADGIYKLLREFGFAHGQDPDQYIRPPSPASTRRRIWAEEAISAILDNGIPDGEPAEAGGAIEHFQKLQAFAQDDRFGLLDEAQTKVFAGYVQEVAEKAQAQQEQERQLAAAAAFQGQRGGEGPGRPAETGPDQSGQAAVQPGELVDESLPTAGGGANGGGI